MKTCLHRFSTLMLTMGFLLGIYRGRVALWQDQDPRPYQIYDIPADELPPDIQSQLRDGIFVESRAELLFFLENFF